MVVWRRLQVQWQQNGGQCGVCGDPYQGPHENEAGGRYATGTIVRAYTSGQIVQVHVQLTGWFTQLTAMYM